MWIGKWWTSALSTTTWQLQDRVVRQALALASTRHQPRLQQLLLPQRLRHRPTPRLRLLHSNSMQRGHVQLLCPVLVTGNP